MGCTKVNWCVCRWRCVCVSPAGAGGPAAAACGPARAGELPWWGAAATGQHRTAESAELWGETGGPHGGAACWGPVQSCGSREPEHRALQVRRQREWCAAKVGMVGTVYYLSGHQMLDCWWRIPVIHAFPTRRCAFLIHCASDEKQSSCGGNTWGKSGCIKLSHTCFSSPCWMIEKHSSMFLPAVKTRRDVKTDIGSKSQQTKKKHSN